MDEPAASVWADAEILRRAGRGRPAARRDRPLGERGFAHRRAWPAPRAQSRGPNAQGKTHAQHDVRRRHLLALARRGDAARLHRLRDGSARRRPPRARVHRRAARRHQLRQPHPRQPRDGRRAARRLCGSRARGGAPPGPAADPRAVRLRRRGGRSREGAAGRPRVRGDRSGARGRCRLHAALRRHRRRLSRARRFAAAAQRRGGSRGARAWWSGAAAPTTSG